MIGICYSLEQQIISKKSCLFINQTAPEYELLSNFFSEDEIEVSIWKLGPEGATSKSG
jgi:hypothetical protein